MSMTRRQTLVAVLRGTNGYTLKELNEMNAIVGDFLTEAESRGISHTQLADRLVAFKDAGGSGLSNAIATIRGEWNAPAVSTCEQKLAALQAGLKELLSQL